MNQFLQSFSTWSRASELTHFTKQTLGCESKICKMFMKQENSYDLAMISITAALYLISL